MFPRRFSDERLAAHFANAINFGGTDVKAAMFLASEALQVLNLIIRLIAVDVVNVVTFRNFAVMKSPHVAMNR